VAILIPGLADSPALLIKASEPLPTPVGSLQSSTVTWPYAGMVFSAAPCWTLDQAERNPELLALALFASPALPRFGAGHRADPPMIVEDTPADPGERDHPRPVLALPVPVDLIIGTRTGCGAMAPTGELAQTLEREVLWSW